MPTLTIQPGQADAYIEKNNPTLKRGLDDFCTIKMNATGSRDHRSLFRFDFSSIPNSATITNAIFTLHCYGETGSDWVGDTAYVRRLTQTSWVEADVTWDEYASANAWATVGGDYTLTDQVSLVLTGVGTEHSYNVTPMVQHAKDNTSKILNIINMIDSSVATSRPLFRTREYLTDQTITPKLVITYTSPEIHVSLTGDDTTGDGSSGSPYLTIQKGVDTARAGDTVIIKAGTYIQSTGTGNNKHTCNVTSQSNGTADNWVTIKGETKHTTILSGNNQDIVVGFKFKDNTAFVRIEDIKFTEYDNASISYNNHWVNNMYVYGCDISTNGIDTFKGCDQLDANANGNCVLNPVNDQARNITIDSCIFHNVTTDNNPNYEQNHTLYLRGSHHTVINNIFYDNDRGWELYLSGHAEWRSSQYNYIANNTIFINQRLSPFTRTRGRAGGILCRTSNNYIENNIIIVPTGNESVGGAINIYSEGQDSVPGESEIYIRNNLTNSENIWMTHDTNRDHVAPGWPVVANNIQKADLDSAELTVDDIFLGTSPPYTTETDFQLKTGSPAINAGKTLELDIDFTEGGNYPGIVLNYDYRNTLIRPQGGTIDIGAYEFGSLSGGVTDVVDFGDTPATIGTLLTSLSDGMSAGDTVSTIATILTSVSDSVNKGDSALSQYITSSANTDGTKHGDSRTCNTVTLAAISDSTIYSDVVTVLADMLVAVSDGIQNGIEISIGGRVFANAGEVINTSDTVAAIADMLLSVTEGSKLSDNIDTGNITQSSVADISEFSENILRGLLVNLNVADGLHIGDVTISVSSSYTAEGRVVVTFDLQGF